MTNGNEMAGRIVDLLNEALELDRDCVSALCHHRVSCNKALGEHRTIQVRLIEELGVSGPGPYCAGMLGILNGLTGVDETGRGAIAAFYDDGAVFDDPDNPPRIDRFGLLDRKVS